MDRVVRRVNSEADGAFRYVDSFPQWLIFVKARLGRGTDVDSIVLKWSPLIATSAAQLVASDAFKIAASAALILAVLILLAMVYRGGAGDEEIEKPVTLCLMNSIEDNTILLAPRHLKERSAHDLKAPRVQFYLQVPECGKYRYRALERPLRISIRGRNSAAIYDHEYKSDGLGGQLGIGSETRDALELYFREVYRREGRRFDADTAQFVIKLKYPTSLNLKYLLQEHPDASVRVGAWVFILTSVFSIVQELIFRQ